MSAAWTTKDIPSQAGRRIIVTGANSGIGWHTALELARAGGEVTITARSEVKGEDAARRIRAVVPGAELRTGVLDLSDPESVRAFADSQLALSRPIDVLINNAGVMALPQRRISVDGHELQFATNVLGPFRLTGLLLPALLQGAAPRVVTVSSNAHKAGGPVPIQDLDSRDGYRPIRVYCTTKLANILFTRELQRRAGDRLLATSCHPGTARTNLGADTTLGMKLMVLAIYPLIQSAAMGAEPTLMAATAKDARPGSHFGPGGFLEWRGHPVEAEPAPFARDEVAARVLFEELERISGVRYAL
ncbi:oxidoreductase [Nannocystis punicea]|uniref:Oxidoreductase n=1 Tax=Nannocystis punicea TaxID=2995304 RepID=A0ABY7H8D0_9BACT|nr:oxidoreductase [Nannocystis poenicansa]WAS95342.1 oxidoreductase [Nannocystis poenicansa]